MELLGPLKGIDKVCMFYNKDPGLKRVPVVPTSDLVSAPQTSTTPA